MNGMYYLSGNGRFGRDLFFIVLTSAVIEGLQVGIPGRTPSIDDLLLNGVGGTVGLLLAAPVCRRLGTFRH